MRLYSLDNVFIEETNKIPKNFTGIVELQFGQKNWYKNGITHREDGPAIKYPDNSGLINEWWIMGKQIYNVTPQEFKLLVDMMKLKGLLD